MDRTESQNCKEIVVTLIMPRYMSKKTVQSILNYKMGFFMDFFINVIKHWFICRPSDSTASDDAEIEPRTLKDTGLF